jgi:aminopeptidase N
MLASKSAIASGLLLGLFACSVGAQSPPGEVPSLPARRPFAAPETPRQTERLREVDIKHIKAELSLDAKKQEVRGKVTHTLTPLHPYLTTIELDCGPRLVVSQVTAGSDSTPCKFAIKDQKLAITLDKPYGPGDTFDLVIAYGGSPAAGLHFVAPDSSNPARPQAIWTQGEAEDNHHWLPCYDYPNDRVTTEMIITVAKPLSVVSNGSLAGTCDNNDGTRTFHWKMDQPHSTYLITVAASDFVAFHDHVDGLPVDYYVTKNVDEATARRFMGKTPKMIRFFDEKTGQKYPYPKYAQVCLPEFGGGMENTSATSMTDNSLLDPIEALERDEDGLVAHELAHQWFGDFLTCKDWSHIWLNEGFASYFDPLFAQHDRGEDEFRLRMEGELKSYLSNDRMYRRPIVETRYTSPMHMFDMMTYAKGGCVLHMLRGLVGEEAWWKAIRTYVSDHKFQVVETDDFRRAVEQATGKDMKWFFDQWLYKAGHPELRAAWHYEDADKTVRVKIEQTQKAEEQTPLFRTPTTLELTDSSGTSRAIPIVIEGASQEFVIPAAAKPQMVLIDPDCWLVKELNFDKPLEESIFQLEHARCVVCRLNAARALAGRFRDDPHAGNALAAAWKRERSVTGRTDLVSLLAGGEAGSGRRPTRFGTARARPVEDGDERFRAALLEAAIDEEARVRVAAIRGLARLKRDDQSEAVLRAAWSNLKEAYGARTTALRALVSWKAKDAEELLTAALKNPVGKCALASTALELLLQQPGPKARELAALYARYGQPRPLRSVAIDAFDRLAKDDPALQDLLIPMIDDPDRTMRFRAWNLAGSFKLRKALPALEARLKQESGGSTGFVGFGAPPTRQTLERVVAALKAPASKSPGTTPPAPPLSELEKQAEDLEARARELRRRIDSLKSTAR